MSNNKASRRTMGGGSSIKRPLCVDLDGTLLKTDTLLESFFSAFKNDASIIIFAIAWLFRGKAYLKYMLYKQSSLNTSRLPINDELLAFLRKEKEKGRYLVLVSGANARLVRRLASHLGIFNQSLGSSAKVNLVGKKKARKLTRIFGDNGFDYIGNHKVDMEIWRYSDDKMIVGTQDFIKSIEKKGVTFNKTFNVSKTTANIVIKQLRVHQWLKNVLVFIPAFASHQITESYVMINSALVFIAMCLLASSTYVLNDLLDLDADRAHHKKKNRPLASGALSLNQGIFIFVFTFSCAFLVSIFLPLMSQLVLLLYLSLTLSYSYFLKKKVIWDISTLSVLYTLRIFAGATATSVEVSHWLFAFSVFEFFFLALIKRVSEIINSKKNDSEMILIAGRGYSHADEQVVVSLSAASGMSSVLILALYLNSSQFEYLYNSGFLLWPICIILMLWNSRVMLKAARGEVDEDPVVFALKDKVSWGCAVVIFVLVLYSI